jgi:hypothetical protein
MVIDDIFWVINDIFWVINDIFLDIDDIKNENELFGRNSKSIKIEDKINSIIICINR